MADFEPVTAADMELMEASMRWSHEESAGVGWT
jgi:hypothetical protein